MNTNTNKIDVLDFTFEQIGDGVATLNLPEFALTALEETATEETETDRIERVLKLYMGIRPLLGSLTRIPLIPPAWRKALTLFIETVDALAIVRGFKAGRDL
ncbi:MAG TPA: hypothetical protein VF618_26195 [Thermoanaerobaculia bacterium]